MSREALDPLEVELRMVVGYYVGARILGATYHLDPLQEKQALSTAELCLWLQE